MNAIGGYFQLDGIRNSFSISENVVALNSGRNALRYILRLHQIKTIYVPFFTCPAVLDAIHAENCHISFYNITEATTLSSTITST
jgi:dTDP-4-amino-4,6-dideoxygalactose transaminase